MYIYIYLTIVYNIICVGLSKRMWYAPMTKKWTKPRGGRCLAGDWGSTGPTNDSQVLQVMSSLCISLTDSWILNDIYLVLVSCCDTVQLCFLSPISTSNPFLRMYVQKPPSVNH